VHYTLVYKRGKNRRIGSGGELDSQVAYPPTPSIATRSPGLAPQFQSALKVVMPAQRRGADSTGSGDSGTWATAEASASMWVA
jgi:hypothetical protein